MDVNAPAFVPGALSANAPEFVPGALSADATRGMSSEAPEFFPGKLGLGGLNDMSVFSMSYDLGDASTRGITSTQHTPSIVPSNAGFLDSMSGTLCGVETSTTFDENKDWEDEVKWDAAGPRWDAEDVVSKMVHPLQTQVGFNGHEDDSVQYIEQLCHGRLSIDQAQDMADMSTASTHIGGNGHDVLHRPDNLVDGVVGLCSLEALDSSDSTWDVSCRHRLESRASATTSRDACQEILGTKVALDVLFPNLERSVDGEMSRHPLGLHINGDRLRHGNCVDARLPSSSEDTKDWNLSRFERAQRGTHEPGAISEECNAFDIAESVAAMALDLDMEDEPSSCRHGGREDLEPSVPSQHLSFPPPSNSGHSLGINGGLLPAQGALWQPPPRISPAPAKLLAPHSTSATAHLSCDSPFEAHGDSLGNEGRGRHRHVPPPPPSEPPPPPPAPLKS